MTLELVALGLRDLTTCGGCAAKADSALVHLLRQSALGSTQAGTLIGLETPDDASVLEINETTSLISTVDFFPPVVQDAYSYGFISALNSLSDVFAMGGTARAALLICGFPSDMSEEDMVACVAGARDACAQSGAEIIGGHTVRVAEAVFGMSVIGYVHPDQIWCKTGMRDGDLLMISKPLGTGVLLATKRHHDELAAVEFMKLSNLPARDALATIQEGVHAVTDVTGFGLAGHLAEMLSADEFSIDLRLPAKSKIARAVENIESGVRTSADIRNRDAFADRVVGLTGASEEAIIFDPQTNGGLLASVAKQHQGFLEANGFIAIGEISKGKSQIIYNHG